MKAKWHTMRVLKWCGVAACATTAALWTASALCFIKWESTDGHRILQLGHGACVAFWYPHDWAFRQRTVEVGWIVQPYDRFGAVELRWAPMIELGAKQPHGVLVPIWPVWLAFAAGTIALFRRDKPTPRGHCRCGYDLTGNTSGTCPECGRKAGEP